MFLMLRKKVSQYFFNREVLLLYSSQQRMRVRYYKINGYYYREGSDGDDREVEQFARLDFVISNFIIAQSYI